MCTLGARGSFFGGEAAIVSGEAAIAMISIEASPLTIAASPRKRKNPSGTQGFVRLRLLTLRLEPITVAYISPLRRTTASVVLNKQGPP